MRSEKDDEKAKSDDMRKNRTIEVYKAFFAWKKAEIKAERHKGHRFWAYARLAIITPWCLVLRWLKKDWKVLVPIFSAVVVAASSSVWGFYLAAAILGWETDAAKWCIGVGSAVWTWWLIGPASPFLAICLAATAAIYAVVKRIRGRNRKKEKK